MNPDAKERVKQTLLAFIETCIARAVEDRDKRIAKLETELAQEKAGAAAMREALLVGLEAAKECRLNATYHIRTMNEALATTAGADFLARLSKAEADVSQVPCCACKGPVVEFSVPNEIWNALIRRDGPETDKEYLCKDCYAAMIADHAMTLRAELSTARASADALAKALEAFPFRGAVRAWTEENWEMPEAQRRAVTEGLGAFLEGAIAAILATHRKGAAE